MGRVWKPVQNPPRMWKHGDLSQKAQKTMLDLQARFHVEQEEFFTQPPASWNQQNALPKWPRIKEEPAGTPNCCLETASPQDSRRSVQPLSFGKDCRSPSPCQVSVHPSHLASASRPAGVSPVSFSTLMRCPTDKRLPVTDMSHQVSEDQLPIQTDADCRRGASAQPEDPHWAEESGDEAAEQADSLGPAPSISLRLKQHEEIRKNLSQEPKVQAETGTTAATTHTEDKARCDRRRSSSLPGPGLERPPSNKRKKSRIENTKEQKIDKFLIRKEIAKKTLDCLSECEQNQILDYVKSAERICMTVKYTDGSTLVSNIDDEKRKLSSIKHPSPKSIVVYVSKPGDEASGVGHIQDGELEVSIPSTDNEECCSFRTLLAICGSSRISKVVFAAKDFVKVLLDRLQGRFEMNTTDWLFLDPQIGMWLLNPDKPVVSLEEMCQQLNIDTEALPTPCSDQCKELLLVDRVMDRVSERLLQQNMRSLFAEIECPLIPVLAQMELSPIIVDTHTLLSFSDILKVLYEELRLDEKLPASCRMKRTSVAHHKSTSEAMLSQLKDLHPLPGLVLEYRQLQKLRSTYVEGMLSCIVEGELKTHWDQTAAATGRLTSHTPNVQAIPKQPVTIATRQLPIVSGQPKETVKIYAREPFVSHSGFVLLAADFQQIELRLLAHLAQDERLQRAFEEEDEDIFNQLAAQWLEKAAATITTSEREQAKRIVYSVMYGVGKEKLAQYLKVNEQTAKAIMSSFLAKFPSVNAFTRKCEALCRQHGYTTTIFHRRRLMPAIHHHSHEVRAQALRQAVNFPVQGSAADLCKAAMLQVDRALRDRNLNTRLLMQIHDELLWEVQEDQLEDVKIVVKSVMEDSRLLCANRAMLHVPLKVSLSCGRSWAHLQPCAP